MIYLTSDLHFNHNKEFIYKPRGFDNIQDHNETIIQRINSTVTDEDDLYILGDLMLGNNEAGMECLRQLYGKKHLILGNHDSTARIQLYQESNLFTEIAYATMIHYNGYHFYLSHFPTFTSNLEKESLKQCTINLYGHTHQQNNFYNDIPFMYHVGVDSHNCFPVSLDKVIVDCEYQKDDCISCL